MVNINREYTTFMISKDNKPAACCHSGDVAAFHTFDCFSNRFLSAEAKWGVDNPPSSNPSTGPLYMEGAKPGDTLKVEIIDIQVGAVGINIIGPTSKFLSNKLNDFEVRRIPVAHGEAKLSDTLSIPVKPMIGVIGVAPSEGKSPTALPGNHGGNMDCSQIKKGAVLYLPVFTEGALLSIGNIHALMGDGEVSECGLEIEGTAIVRVSVLPGTKRTAPALNADGKWITIASCSTLDDAAEEASRMMLDFLINEVGMKPSDAGVIIGLCGNLIICQKCNMYKTVRMELPVECFAYTGYIIE